MADTSPFERSDTTGGALLIGGVGLFMLALFGWIAFDALLDLRGFPAEPTPTTVAELLEMAEPIPHGAWVRLTDAHLDCSVPPLVHSGNVYSFVTDGHGGTRVLLSQPAPATPLGECPGDPLVEVVGVPHPEHPGRIVGVDWPSVDWSQWPRPRLAQLWMSSGPDSAKENLLVGGGASLFSLLFVAAGAWLVLDARRARPKADERGRLRGGFLMPLSTGASSRTAFSMGPAALQFVAFTPLFFAKSMPDWTLIPVGIIWALWFFVVFGSLMEGWKLRASDVRLAPEGLAIESGPLDGVRWSWAELTPDSVDLAGAGSDDSPDARNLCIGTAVVAQASEAEELDSLQTLASTVEALGGQARGEARPTPTLDAPKGAVRCPHCGAVATPSHAESQPCAYCGGDVPMPQQVRDQMAAQLAGAAGQAETERLLAQLLRQPGAFATNLLCFVALPPLLLSYPLLSIVYDEFHQLRHVLEPLQGLSLFLGGIAASHGLGLLLKAQVDGRAAIQLVSTRFAATPPVAPGGAWRCSRCGAGLPGGNADQLIRRCLHCGSDGLVGLNLVPTAVREVDQALSLRSVLEQRLAVRRRSRGLALLSLALLVASAVVLKPVLETVLNSP